MVAGRRQNLSQDEIESLRIYNQELSGLSVRRPRGPSLTSRPFRLGQLEPRATEGDYNRGDGVRLRVRGDALKRRARLRLERQAVAVEDAPSPVP